MSDAPVEGAVGWVRVGCGLLALAFLPLWGMLTALVWALDDDLREMPFMVAFAFAAPAGAFWLVVALVLVAGLLGVWFTLAWIDQRREQGEREAADLDVHADAVLPSDAWDNPDVLVPTGLAPDDEPEPELPPAPPPIEPEPAEPRREARVDGLFGGSDQAGADDEVTDATEEVEW